MKKFFSVLYCVLFFGICVFFSAALLLPDAVVSGEPDGSLPLLFTENGINHEAGNEYEEWFSKNFAFRDAVVDLFSSLKMNLLAEGNDQVIVGTDGFLFFDDTTADFLGTSSMTDEEIRKTAAALKRLNDRTSEHGAEFFLFVCAPNKNTVYSENMPARYRKSAETSNLDRLYPVLDELDVLYIDLRPLLCEAAERELVYHKRDTHWNGAGARVAFEAVAARFGGSLPDLSERGPVVSEMFEGDLDALLFPGKVRYDRDVTYDFNGLFVFTSAYSTPMDIVIAARGGGSGKLLMFRDSFANAWIPYAASSFAEIRLERVTPYRTEYIETWEPDFVAVEIAERNLPTLADVAGTALSCGDFVVSCTDDTGAVFDFSGGLPSAEEEGEFEIGITASDDYGNSVQKTAVLRVWDASNMVSIDLNATELDVIMKQMFPEITAVDLASVDTDTFGEYSLRAVSDLGVYLWRVSVTDTTVPRAKTINLCSRAGENVSAERFVAEITDVSPCTVSYAAEPDFERLGFQKISLNVDDVFGNRTSVRAKLLVSDFPEVLQVEYGSTMDQVTDALFENMVSLRNSFAMEGTAPELRIGTSELRYTTVCGDYDIRLDVKDTTPPTLRLKDVSVYKGDPVKIEDFIDGYDDLSAVTCSYKKDPPADVKGSYSGLTTRSGNCYIYYAVAGALLTRAGLENIDIQRNDPYNPHYWNLVKVDGAWYHFDTCPHYAGHELQCFLLTDAEVWAYSENEVEGYYSFDTSLYPATP